MPRYLIVDHTAVPGGAELALPRMARHSQSDLEFLFLEPGFASLNFPVSAKVDGPASQLGFFAQLRLLRRHIRSGKYSAVVSNTLRAAVLTALVQGATPHFMYLRDGADSASLSFGKRLILEAVVLPRVSRIFPNSQWTGQTVRRRYEHKVSSPIFSPSGVGDPPGILYERPTHTSTPLRLLSLSRVVEWKGIHIVLEALSELGHQFDRTQITLTIAGANLMGPDSYLRELNRKASALPFDVSFVGHQEDVYPLLYSHDVLVHASIRPEPFGQVVVQGLASGMTVVASDAGGPAEVIQHGKSGLLHSAGNTADLARQIAALLRDSSQRATLEAGGSQRARAFSDHVVVRKFDDELITAVLLRKRQVGI